MKQIAILGATGSIGTQTLDVVAGCRDRVRAIGLTAHSRWRELFEQARQVRPQWVVVTDESLADDVDASGLAKGCELLFGEQGVAQVVTDPRVDTVVAAMVGAAGLRSTLAALEAGKTIALANKETLVVGGPLVTELARGKNAPLLPVDSEHSAIFQCICQGKQHEVERIILTASGGPFRDRPLNSFDAITPEEALRHPTWNMGPKITIDSATMMNKALEVIEAHWLFGLDADRISVVIHPQSMVHSMVETVDGSVLAQISPPDMRLPIQYALTYPERWPSPSRRLDLTTASCWDFSPPCAKRYPALELGFAVVRRGGTSGAALNAANEVAVARFLDGQIRFPQIIGLCREILDSHPFSAQPTLADLLEVDCWARREAERWE